MLASEQFSGFFAAVADDPRINTTHICLYMALLHYWKEHGLLNPMRVFSHEVMQIAKILSGATYHRCIRDLHDFGYIRYEASYKRNQGSKIYMGDGVSSSSKNVQKDLQARCHYFRRKINRNSDS